MKLRLDAEADELEEKGPDLLFELAKSLDAHAPALANALRKAAVPTREPVLKFQALQDLKAITDEGYRQTLENILTEVGAVLDEATVQKSYVDAVLDEEGERFQKVKQAVVDLVGYSDWDFQEGGLLYGKSTNELLDVLKREA